MPKEFVKFSPTQQLKDEALKRNSYYSLARDCADVMSEVLQKTVGVYGASVNSMDFGGYVLGYYD